MSDYTELTQERLKELLSYDPATGIFTWNISSRNVKKGQVAGFIKNGKWSRWIRLDGHTYMANRLAWLWVHGRWPGVMRFRNGNQSDCSIDNLYESQRFRTDPLVMKDYQRSRALRKFYGMTLRDYEEKFVAQEGKCAICQNPETVMHKGEPISLAVDHNHTTGQVRDLLCRDCNQGLGKFREDRGLLVAALRYLDKWEDGQIVVPITRGTAG